MIHRYYAVDHPAYNGRVPLPSEKAWYLTIPIGPEDKLEINLGQKGRNSVLEGLSIVDNQLPNDQKALMLLEAFLMIFEKTVNIIPEEQLRRVLAICKRATWIADLPSMSLADVLTGIEQLQEDIRS